jgi:[ribosomal protein S18]-alanine N-acetyltransferase
VTPETLAAVHARAFVEERAWTAAEFAALLAQKSALVAGDARSFVLGRVTLDEAEVLTLATDPSHRRQGLARVGLAAFEAGAAGRGAGRVFLEVAEDNTAARALYAAAGYAQVGRRARYYAGGVAALVLEKRLGAA